MRRLFRLELGASLLREDPRSTTIKSDRTLPDYRGIEGGPEGPPSTHKRIRPSTRSDQTGV